jgi:hypothetical protein
VKDDAAPEPNKNKKMFKSQKKTGAQKEFIHDLRKDVTKSETKKKATPPVQTKSKKKTAA